MPFAGATGLESARPTWLCNGMSFRALLSVVLASAALGLTAVPAHAGRADIPIPGWASLRATKDNEINMRAGPGEDYRIVWVYHHPHLPVRVLRASSGWRLVQDPDGARGWVILGFLNRERTAYVTEGDPVVMRAAPNTDSHLLWRLTKGVTGTLGPCDKGWCQLDVDGRKGYVTAARLWGLGD